MRRRQENAEEAKSEESRPAAASDAEEVASRRVRQSTLVIPRLISVVEIIKREWLKTSPAPSLGLYQYNEIGTLEERSTDSVGERSEMLLLALKNKTQCVV